MSTLSTLRSRVRLEKVRIDPNGRIQSDTILNSNINQAVTQIQQDGDFGWHFNDAEYSVATVASTATYALPSDFVRIEKGTVKWNTSLLERADYNWLVRTNSSLAVDGTPAYYYLRGVNIGLFQRPNEIQNLTFNYRKKLAAMAADGTDSGLPSDFDEAIIQYATYLCFAPFAGKEDKALQAVQAYNEAMKGLNAQYLGTRDEENFGMGFETINNHL